MAKTVKQITIDGETITYKSKIDCKTCFARGWMRVANKTKGGFLERKTHKELCLCIKVLKRERPEVRAKGRPWYKNILSGIIRMIRIIWWHLVVRKYWIKKVGKDIYHCYWCNSRLELVNRPITFSEMCKCKPPFGGYNGYKNFSVCHGCRRYAIPMRLMIDDGIKPVCIDCIE